MDRGEVNEVFLKSKEQVRRSEEWAERVEEASNTRDNDYGTFRKWWDDMKIVNRELGSPIVVFPSHRLRQYAGISCSHE